MSQETFEVDTHLFRELGELLVGRNSTALVELIKNAYDADATRIVIDGRNLHDPKRGKIVISDDGIGMSPDHFRRGFLTIAGRLKDSSERKSRKFKRRFTGAKGIGRLAAHKLASFIEIDSCPDSSVVKPGDQLLHASIDWDIIETKTLFSEIATTNAVTVETERKPSKATPGTTITLTRLRKKWTPAELVQFQSEVQSYRPPSVVVNVPRGTVKTKLLFDIPTVADTATMDPGITYELTGDFDTGDDYWVQIAQNAQWLVEVDASDRRGTIKTRISPTTQGYQKFEEAKVINYSYEKKRGDSGPYFQSRFYVREGNQGNRAFQQWIKQGFGIRVYSEGFRVLPYGEASNDWLSLDADYNTRPKTLSFLDKRGFSSDDTDEKEGHQMLGNKSFFGAVFLTIKGTPDLQMLINREGFNTNETFEGIVEIMRTAVYLSYRARSSGKRKEIEERRSERDPNPPSRNELKTVVESSVARATEYAQEARQLAAQGDIAAAKEKIDLAAAHFSTSSEAHGRLMTEGSTLRVLASVGTQMSAFVHEINAILGMARALESAVSEIASSKSLDAAQRGSLRQMRSAIEDLRRGIERQASYLTDVISPDARRRRSRQSLHDRFEAGRRLISSVASRRNIEIENKIPADLKSPPMFPAELTVVFSNLLTNAVKAADVNGTVAAKARALPDGRVSMIIENTGAVVDIDDSERWFQPFESTTVETDPVLGQGMGMGLPITRNLLEEYGATIAFRKPSAKFSTAIEIIFPV